MADRLILPQCPPSSLLFGHGRVHAFQHTRITKCHMPTYIRRNGRHFKSSQEQSWALAYTADSEATQEVGLTEDSARQHLLAALSSVQSTGLYGLESSQRAQILDLVERVEASNPLEAPTEHLEECQGMWRLLFSTVTILGRRRIKLGLKDIVNVGELTQHIDIGTRHTVNVVNFDILVFGKFQGSLTLEATFEPVSSKRVSIKLERASLVPEQFQKLFEKNYDLLLNIFNPEGWLDITYVDAGLRIGRDDKGNVFVLERV